MPNLTWIGKDAVVNHDKQVPFRLLKKVKSHSIGENSQNLVIHGDNLEALKALMPYYQNKIKCIYIDPPYNTGKEGWIYNDRVNSPKIKKWLGKVVGNESEDLCGHDKWMSMMYPRLKLLHNLLAEDGIIFISIDDNEVHNLRPIMDEIFGEPNFVTTLIWNTEGHTDNQFEIKVNHEYVLVYLKNQLLSSEAISHVVDPNTREESNLWKGYAENSITKNGPGNPPSEILLEKGFPCKVDSISLDKSKVPSEFFKNIDSHGHITREASKQFDIEYPIRLDPMEVKNGKLVDKCRVFSGWANANKLKRFIENGYCPLQETDGELTFYLSENGVIYYKKIRSSAQHILSVLRNMGTTEQARSQLEEKGIKFSYPKPLELVKYLIEIGSKSNSIVLDSFAGSGTTGHAVMDLNKKDQGKRRFILVQLDEKLRHPFNLSNNSRIENVIDLTRERLKAFIQSEGYKDGFDFCELDKPLFNEEGQIEDECSFEQLASYIYFTETQTNLDKKSISGNFIGDSGDIQFYLFFKEKGKNLLNKDCLKKINKNERKKVVYADKCLLDDLTLLQYNIQFKQIPYEVKVF